MRQLTPTEIENAPDRFDYYFIDSCGTVRYQRFKWAGTRPIKPWLALVRPLSPVKRDKLPHGIFKTAKGK